MAGRSIVHARLHLHKAENAPVPADEIDFAAIVRQSDVSRDEAITEALQIEVGFGFAALAEDEVCRLALGWAAEFLQRANDQVSQVAHGVKVLFEM